MNHRMMAFIAVTAMVIAGLAAVSFIDDESDGATYEPLYSNPTVQKGNEYSIYLIRYSGYGSDYVWPSSISISGSIPGMTLSKTTTTIGGYDPNGKYVSDYPFVTGIQWNGTPTTTGTYTITYSYKSIAGEDTTYNTYSGTRTVTVVEPSYTHTVKYSSNGGTGSMSDTVVTDTVDGSTSVTLAANSFVKSGYHFVGWKVGSTVYQPGEKVPVGANASVTATAQWEVNSLTIKTIPTQYSVAGKNVSFSVSVISEPSGASVTYSKSNVSSGLNVTINGSTITCSASAPGTYTFVLTASANGFQTDSRTVTVTVVPVLAFANTPAIGVIGN